MLGSAPAGGRPGRPVVNAAVCEPLRARLLFALFRATGPAYGAAGLLALTAHGGAGAALGLALVCKSGLASKLPDRQPAWFVLAALCCVLVGGAVGAAGHSPGVGAVAGLAALARAQHVLDWRARVHWWALVTQNVLSWVIHACIIAVAAVAATVLVGLDLRIWWPVFVCTLGLEAHTTLLRVGVPLDLPPGDVLAGLTTAGDASGYAAYLVPFPLEFWASSAALAHAVGTLGRKPVLGDVRVDGWAGVLGRGSDAYSLVVRASLGVLRCFTFRALALDAARKSALETSVVEVLELARLHLRVLTALALELDSPEGLSTLEGVLYEACGVLQAARKLLLRGRLAATTSAGVQQVQAASQACVLHCAFGAGKRLTRLKLPSEYRDLIRSLLQ